MTSDTLASEFENEALEAEETSGESGDPRIKNRFYGRAEALREAAEKVRKLPSPTTIQDDKEMLRGMLEAWETWGRRHNHHEPATGSQEEEVRRFVDFACDMLHVELL